MHRHKRYKDGPIAIRALGPLADRSSLGMRPLLLRDVLALIPFKKSWLYKSIREGHFPGGHLIGRRRFWYAYEIEDTMRSLARPAQRKVGTPAKLSA